MDMLLMVGFANAVDVVRVPVQSLGAGALNHQLPRSLHRQIG